MAPDPAEKTKPMYNPPLSAPSQMLVFNSGAKTYRKKGANKNSSTAIIHSRCFFSPSLSEITPSTGWKAIADSEIQENTIPVCVLFRPITSDSQIGRNGKQVAMMKK